MGAWGYEVLSNDKALDTMYDLVDSKNLKEDIIKLLEDGDRDEMVLACEVVDISINGTKERILGSLYKYEEFFESIQNNPMADLRLKALEKIKYIQKYDNGWIDRVKEQRANLLKEIESRLKLEQLLGGDKMIKFRPHRGSLADAMSEMKIFNSKEDMFNAIVVDWNGFISYEDLSISGDSGKDDRIDWKETRYVCTKRIGDEIYDVPQCIGMCSIED